MICISVFRVRILLEKRNDALQQSLTLCSLIPNGTLLDNLIKDCFCYNSWTFRSRQQRRDTRSSIVIRGIDGLLEREGVLHTSANPLTQHVRSLLTLIEQQFQCQVTSSRRFHISLNSQKVGNSGHRIDQALSKEMTNQINDHMTHFLILTQRQFIQTIRMLGKDRS